MRVMSFAATIDEMRDRSKTVTRRNGWRTLKPGDRLLAVTRSRGVRVEDRTVLGTIEVVSVRREYLSEITRADVAREGFPGQDAAWFINMYGNLNNVPLHALPDLRVTRIEFRHVERAS